MKPLNEKESEKATERYLQNECAKLGGIAFKWISSNKAGVPDRICLFPIRIIRFAEVKSEGVKPSALQKITFALLKQLGFPVAVIDTRAKVAEFIQNVKNEMKEKSQ